MKAKTEELDAQMKNLKSVLREERELRDLIARLHSRRVAVSRERLRLQRWFQKERN